MARLDRARQRRKERDRLAEGQCAMTGAQQRVETWASEIRLDEHSSTVGGRAEIVSSCHMLLHRTRARPHEVRDSHLVIDDRIRAVAREDARNPGAAVGMHEQAGGATIRRERAYDPIAPNLTQRLEVGVGFRTHATIMRLVECRLVSTTSIVHHPVARRGGEEPR